jgi:hypothetical protein
MENSLYEGASSVESVVNMATLEAQSRVGPIFSVVHKQIDVLTVIRS